MNLDQDHQKTQDSPKSRCRDSFTGGKTRKESQKSEYVLFEVKLKEALKWSCNGNHQTNFQPMKKYHLFEWEFSQQSYRISTD